MYDLSSHQIPNIHIGRIYNNKNMDLDIHYETFERLADFFGRNTPIHRHNGFYQVHFLTHGGIRLQLDGEVYCERAPLVFLTPPSVPHAFYTEEDTGGHVVTVRQEIIRSLHAVMPGQWPEPQPRTAFFLTFGEMSEDLRAMAQRLFSLSRAMQMEFEASEPGRDAALLALCHLFFITLARLSLARRPDAPLKRERGEDVRVFLGFCDLIEARFRDHVTLPDYARSLGVTEARLNDICRRMAGLASKEVVHDRLAQEARRLLRFSATPVGEIAYALGFSDPAYFSRFFARHAGCSPRDFRLSHRESDEIL